MSCTNAGSSVHVRGDPLAACSCSIATDKIRAARNMLFGRISHCLWRRARHLYTFLSYAAHAHFVRDKKYISNIRYVE